MGIVIKIIKVNGAKTEKVINYTAHYWDAYLYPDGTTREVKKLFFFPPKIKTITQISEIHYHLDGVVDIWHVNKWTDIKEKQNDN